MAASPEFYKPPATPQAFSPLRPSTSLLLLPQLNHDGDDDLYTCRTPTGSGITYLREPTTCPPAPRKAPPPPCKKRLFHQQRDDDAPLISISLRLDDLHRIFRPHPPPPDKRRRSARHQASS